MSQKLLLGSFQWIENTSSCSKDFIENYKENSDEGYVLKIDVQYPQKLHDLQNDLPVLSERIKIVWKNQNWKSW